MTDARKNQTRLDEEKFDDSITRLKKISGVCALDFIAHFEEGRILSEYRNYFCIIQMRYREIIPIRAHLPEGVKKLLKADEFGFTLDQEFERVMDECFKPRLDPEDRWVRRKMKKNLLDLHAMGLAHSTDIYRDNKLVGGIINLQRAGSCISLSVFHRVSGAGNAALAAQQGLLLNHGFYLHDAISPSNISRHFGGKMIPVYDYVRMQSIAQQKEEVAMPEIPNQLSVARYLKLKNG